MGMTVGEMQAQARANDANRTIIDNLPKIAEALTKINQLMEEYVARGRQ